MRFPTSYSLTFLTIREYKTPLEYSVRGELADFQQE